MYRGFLDGTTGLFTEPYQGARDEGAKGFLKGCGKGLTGAFLKPSAGKNTVSRLLSFPLSRPSLCTDWR